MTTYTEATPKKIIKLFAFHKLNEDGQKKSRQIAEEFQKLFDRLLVIVGGGNLPDGIGSREFIECKSKLEEACFYAKKAMATQDRHQEL